MKLIILECDETLKDKEQMIDIKTIGVQEGNKSLIGYVGLVKNTNTRDIRYCDLRTREVIINSNNLVI